MACRQRREHRPRLQSGRQPTRAHAPRTEPAGGAGARSRARSTRRHSGQGLAGACLLPGRRGGLRSRDGHAVDAASDTGGTILPGGASSAGGGGDVSDAQAPHLPPGRLTARAQRTEGENLCGSVGGRAHDAGPSLRS